MDVPSCKGVVAAHWIAEARRVSGSVGRAELEASLTDEAVILVDSETSPLVGNWVPISPVNELFEFVLDTEGTGDRQLDCRRLGWELASSLADRGIYQQLEFARDASEVEFSRLVRGMKLVVTLAAALLNRSSWKVEASGEQSVEIHITGAREIPETWIHCSAGVTEYACNEILTSGVTLRVEKESRSEYRYLIASK